MVDRVLALARRYGVRIVRGDPQEWFKSWSRSGDTYRGEYGMVHESFGFAAICLEARVLYAADEIAEKQGDRWAATTLLHELAHIVTHPPGIGLDDVDEGAILVQWERVAVRSVVPELLGQVISWQGDAILWRSSLAEMIANDPDAETAEQLDWWIRGIRFLEQHGWIREGFPTYTIPEWTPAMLADFRRWMRED